MQTLIDLSIKLGLFYVFIALGFLVARYYNKQKQLNKYVTFVLINILLPILIIDTVMTAPSDILAELPMIVAFTILMHVLGFGLMYLRLYRSSIENKTKGSMLLTTTFPNGIFIPVPLILLFIGESGIAVVAIFSMTQMILFAIFSAYFKRTGSTSTRLISESASAEYDRISAVKRLEKV